MKKIKRVAKPDLVVFVGDALTGNDATQQASKFNEAIDLDGVILTKADADSKGGASLSIGYVIKNLFSFWEWVRDMMTLRNMMLTGC